MIFAALPFVCFFCKHGKSLTFAEVSVFSQCNPYSQISTNGGHTFTIRYIESTQKLGGGLVSVALICGSRSPQMGPCSHYYIPVIRRCNRDVLNISIK